MFTQSHITTGITTRGWRPSSESGTSTVNTTAPSSARPNHSGRSDCTVKLHASAGTAIASAAHAVVGGVERDAEEEHRDARARDPDCEPDAAWSPMPRSSTAYISSASHDCAIQCVPAAVNEYGSACGIPVSRISPPVRRCQRNELSPSDPDDEREPTGTEEERDEPHHRDTPRAMAELDVGGRCRARAGISHLDFDGCTHMIDFGGGREDLRRP